MATFYLKIVTSNKVFFAGKVSVVIVTATDGEKAFMAHHEEMVLALKPGEIRFQKEDGTWVTAVSGVGVVQAANNRVTAIVESAELPEDIDAVRAREARDRAMEEMRQKQSIREYKTTQASLARAINRMRHSSEQGVIK